MLGSQDLLIGLVLALFFFGAKRLPERAGSLGKSMKEFKKAVESGGEETEAATPAEPDAHQAALPTPVQAICVSCHVPLKAEWRHCPHCGAAIPLASDAPEPRPPVS